MTHWRGHKATTSSMLQTLLEDARAGGCDYSWSERVLCTACECWAAAMHGTLGEYLGVAAERKLWLGEVSFTAIGLPDIAMILRRGRIDLTTATSRGLVETIARHIEYELAHHDAPVDDAIGRFAADLRRSHLASSAN